MEVEIQQFLSELKMFRKDLYKMIKCLSYNMREPHEYYADWKKPDTECDSLWFYLHNISRVRSIGLEWEQRLTAKGHRELLWGKGSALNGTFVMIVNFVQTHKRSLCWTLKMNEFMVCKLYPNKTVKKYLSWVIFDTVNKEL